MQYYKEFLLVAAINLILQLTLLVAGLLGFLTTSHCNSDGAFLTLIYSMSSALISGHLVVTYCEFMTKHTLAESIGHVSTVIFIIQAIFVMIFASFIKNNLSMIAVEPGCIGWFWGICLFISTASIWLNIAWMVIQRSIFYVIAYREKAKAREREKFREQFLSELENIYQNITGIGQLEFERFLEKYEDLIQSEPLTSSEKARLLDYFKIRDYEDLFNKTCLKCEMPFLEGVGAFRHPGCSHAFHSDNCFSASEANLQCPICTKQTRHYMLKELRGELYPTNSF